MLRHAKILVMDEATASLDFNTGMLLFPFFPFVFTSSVFILFYSSDALVKTTVRECFASKTLITIAHRLDTIVCTLFPLSTLLFICFSFSSSSSFLLYF